MGREDFYMKSLISLSLIIVLPLSAQAFTRSGVQALICPEGKASPNGGIDRSACLKEYAPAPEGIFLRDDDPKMQEWLKAVIAKRSEKLKAGETDPVQVELLQNTGDHQAIIEEMKKQVSQNVIAQAEAGVEYEVMKKKLESAQQAAADSTVSVSIAGVIDMEATQSKQAKELKKAERGEGLKAVQLHKAKEKLSKSNMSLDTAIIAANKDREKKLKGIADALNKLPKVTREKILKATGDYPTVDKYLEALSENKVVGKLSDDEKRILDSIVALQVTIDSGEKVAKKAEENWKDGTLLQMKMDDLLKGIANDDVATELVEQKLDDMVKGSLFEAMVCKAQTACEATGARATDSSRRIGSLDKKVGEIAEEAKKAAPKPASTK